MILYELIFLLIFKAYFGKRFDFWKLKNICITMNLTIIIFCSTYDFFEKFPHKNTVASNNYFVQNFSLISNNLKSSLKSNIHKDVHSNDDSFDLSSSIKFNSQFFGDVFVKIWWITLFWESPFDTCWHFTV